jgi:hypothetical protein
LGYAIWYRVLPSIKATATVQLSVPMIATLGGVLLLGEPATWPMALSGLAISGGIGLVLKGKQNAAVTVSNDLQIATWVEVHVIRFCRHKSTPVRS